MAYGARDGRIQGGRAVCPRMRGRFGRGGQTDQSVVGFFFAAFGSASAGFRAFMARAIIASYFALPPKYSRRAVLNGLLSARPTNFFDSSMSLDSPLSNRFTTPASTSLENSGCSFVVGSFLAGIA